LVTIKQFVSIRAKAQSMTMRHTTYAKAVALASINEPTVLDGRLLKVLQLVSMAAIAAAKGSKSIQEIATMLEEAEQLMLNIINNIH
jgi:hypothetical protein